MLKKIKTNKMKAGLFICDHVAPKYQAAFGDYSNMFTNLFPEFEFQFYDACNGVFPKNLDECDIYMATGSRHSAYDDFDWIIKLKEIIKLLYEQEKYFIGFCFGHQIMGEALGGKVEKSTRGWCTGVYEFDVIRKKEWMLPFQSKLNLLMMCQDQILTLPNDSTVLARNENCPNALIQVGERFLGIQAHPEFSKDYNQLLMEKRKNRIGEEVVKKGLESLQLPIHRETIRNWILNFCNVIK